LILPIVRDLHLLYKCLHGETQNANEALNEIIWARVPKEFVGRATLDRYLFSCFVVQ